MSAAKFDLALEQGATFSRDVIYKDSDGEPVDLTGSTLRGQIRKKTSDESPLASFSFVIADQETNKGQFNVSLTRTQTSGLPAATQEGPRRRLAEYTYDIEREVGSNTYRILEGLVFVSPEVTR